MSQQVTPLKENFNAGEFGARMHARVQFDKYQNAGAIYRNILPLPQGGYTHRPGFRYVAAAKSASVRPWLVPFVFSTTQAYVLEFGEVAVRFYRDQGQIATADTNAAITNGNFPSNITGWTSASNGSGGISHDATDDNMVLTAAGSGNEAIAYQAVTTSMTTVEHVVRFQVIGDPGDEILVRVGSAAGGAQYLTAAKKQVGWHTISFTPSASPFYLEFENTKNKAIAIDDVLVVDNTAVELVTPWSESAMPNVRHAQSSDVLYLCAGGAIRPYRLERYGHAAWSLVKALFEDGPYLNQNTTTTTLVLSATSGNGINVTASAITGINDDVGWRATDVGRLIRWEDAAGKWTWLQIVSITSSTIAVADIKGADASATTATADWRLGEWNDTDGWPSTAGFIQQRLGLAATAAQPQKFWLSKSADIETFADEDVDGDVQDDSSISYRFAALESNAIRWIAARRKPIIGTQGGQWTLRSDGAVLTPTDIAADFEVSGGVAAIQPVEMRSRLLFAQAQARKLLEFTDVLQASGVQGFDSFDLTLLNDRILKGGVTQLAYAQEPDSVLWTVRADGQAPTLTYQPEQSVIGWARQIHGGSFQGGDAVIESIAAIPGQDGSGQFKDSTGRHEVWAAVKVTINGSTARHIECLEKSYSGDEDLQEDAFCVDSGLTLDSPFTITGVTAADPGVVTTSAAHGFVDGDLVRIVRVVGMTELNGITYKVAGKTSTTFQLNDEDDANIDTSVTASYTAYITAGEVRKKVTAISGLTHLEGEVVQVFADGAVQTDKTVSSGAITIDTSASVVHVGLSYECRWKSLKLAYGGLGGTAVGKPKSIADIILVLMETAEGALSVAVEDEDGEGTFAELDLRAATQVDGDPVPFFTGEKPLGISAGYDQDLRLIVKGTAPVPATVLAIAPELEIAT